MSITGVISGLMLVAVAVTVGWFLADIMIPQSEIDEIDAIGRWAKEELDRRAQQEEGEQDAAN